MAYGSAAYRLDRYPDYAPQSSRQSRRAEVRAMRTGAQEQDKPSLLVTAGIMAAIILVVVAALSFARIMLTSQAVSTMIQSDSISGQITEARATGVSLEMEQSVLSNPHAIEAAAQRLGMSAPASVGTLVLDPDVVAVSNDGTLSLSETVKNVVEVQG